MRSFLLRLTALFQRRRLDVELDDEVQFHIEMLSQEHMRRGLSAADARMAALRSFGGVIQMKESYREQRGLPAIEMFLQDARYGIRALFRAPAFTAAALLTLALGIGANSAIFSVVNAVLLRPLDYPAAERIVQMHRNSGGIWAGQTGRRYMFFRDQMKSFDALAAWRGTAFNLASGDSAEYVPALAVSKEYFTVFAGTPLFGRVFNADEDRETGPDAVILGHSIWQRMFGRDPSVVGRTISLGDRSFTVVGVMPQGFDSIRSAEIYVPLKPSTTGPGGGSNYTVAGRRRDGVTAAQANAESNSVFEAYKATLPNAKFEGEFSPVFISYQEGLSRPVRPALMLMLGAVGMLLLIACANTANLLLARASGRGREISVRAALGAGRSRIIRQLLTESVVLFFLGGLLGIAIAYWALPALLALTPPGYLPFDGVKVDGVVLAATLALSLITGFVFGLAPALSLSRQDLVEAFKDDGPRTTASRRSGWLRRSLVVGEVALCMLLLVGAGLLIQTFVKLRAVDPGFDIHNVLTARMSLLGDRYATSQDLNRLYDLGLERIRTNTWRLCRGRRQLCPDRARPERQFRLPRHGSSRNGADRLAVRHDGLLQDDGDSDRGGPWVRGRGSGGDAARRGGQPGICAAPAQRESDRSADPGVFSRGSDRDRRSCQGHQWTEPGAGRSARDVRSGRAGERRGNPYLAPVLPGELGDPRRWSVRRAPTPGAGGAQSHRAESARLRFP